MTLSLLADRLYGSDSLVEIVDDSSLWEEDITMTTGWITPSKTVQSELEIRYFINASVTSYCLEWVVILGVLLQDLSIFMHVQQQLNYLDSQTTFPDDIDTRLLNGINSLSEWAAINWYSTYKCYHSNLYTIQCTSLYMYSFQYVILYDLED